MFVVLHRSSIPWYLEVAAQLATVVDDTRTDSEENRSRIGTPIDRPLGVCPE